MPEESNDKQNRIEGLEARELLRGALGDPTGEPVEPSEADEARIRAEITERLEDLEILELLGRGGMGYVYRARQKKLDREVALKVIAPEAERQADFAERFAREARALARLSHPNIVAVHDYGQDGRFGWLVMEYVDGSNLRDLIRGGKLDPAEALALVPKICDALQYAHDQGVVHRDVKPENILVDREGGVKIADFGLAKLTGTPAALVSLTGSRQVLGTFRYMAPEQLDRPQEVDHRADIYSLGVVFYEMLTGEIPMGRFDPPSQHSGASPQVDDVVLRALEKAPERRYQRAAEVKSDLESVDPDASRPSGAANPEPSGRQRERRLSALAVASCVLFGIGFLPSPVAWIVWAMNVERALADPASWRASILGILIGLAGFVGLAFMIAACVLGFRALRGIREEWPRLYGTGAAAVGAWGGILFVPSATLVQAFPPSVVPITALGVLVADVALIVWYRQWFLKRCEASRQGA